MRALAQETLRIAADGRYVGPSGSEVRIEVGPALAGTRVYRPDELAALVAGTGRGGRTPRITVTPEGTAQAGERLVRAGPGRVAVLNFASARNVGGGFLNGARAQEEELCRASALYPCLESARSYYDANRAHRSALYTDHLVWSPGVPFFRDADLALIDEPYALDVITSPAPNTGAVRQSEPESAARIPDTFRRRAATILAVAEAQGCERIVLGAWGCGAFQGDPQVAAEAFLDALRGRFADAFEEVVFAVLAMGERGRRNLEIFRSAAGG